MRRELNLAADAPVVFSAGRLVSKKGFEYLIDAGRQLAIELPDLRLVIAGDGDLAKSSWRARRHRAGRAPSSASTRRTRSARLAAAADVIAVPSVHDEAGNVDGLPNFALEALATATPVVATTVGGLPQAIDDGVTGLLVAERDAGALAAAIAGLLATPDADAHGRAAREAVMRNFGWARVAERFEAVYDKACRLIRSVWACHGALIRLDDDRAAAPAGLSIFFPAYNDSGTIASLVITARQAAQRLTSDFEIIIVNDGSADATAGSPTSWRGRIRKSASSIIRQPRLRRRAAQRLRRRDEELIFYTDGDAQYDPAELEVLWPHMTDGGRSGQRLQDQPLRSVASHRDRPDLSLHGEDALRAAGARRRLRLPADAPRDLRPRARSRRTAASSASR